MNAGLCRLPSPYCTGCVRGERLHSVYIIKARHRHRGPQIQTQVLSGFVSLFLSLSLTLTDTITHSLIHHSLPVPLKKSEFPLCLVGNKIIAYCNEKFREKKVHVALSLCVAACSTLGLRIHNII